MLCRLSWGASLRQRLDRSGTPQRPDVDLTCTPNAMAFCSWRPLSRRLPCRPPLWPGGGPAASPCVLLSWPRAETGTPCEPGCARYTLSRPSRACQLSAPRRSTWRHTGRPPPDPWAAFWFRLSQSHGGEYLTATFETLDPDGQDHIRQSVLQYQGWEAQRVTFEALVEADVKRTEAT